MTVNEMLNAALAVFFEDDVTDYKPFSMTFVNLLLAECFDVNNRIRRFKKLLPLKEIPEVKNMDDKIPYEVELTNNGMIYGLTAKLYIDEQDNSRMSYFLQEYADRVNAADRWVVKF